MNYDSVSHLHGIKSMIDGMFRPFVWLPAIMDMQVFEVEGSLCQRVVQMHCRIAKVLRIEFRSMVSC